MPTHLVLVVPAVMSSWGDIAVGRHRPSLSAPTRSAVLGLVAGALGYARDADDRHASLEATLAFAVCVESPGHRLVDYHTAQVPGRSRDAVWPTRQGEIAGPRQDLNTILSTREYVTDALYVFVLWKRAEGGVSLDMIARALQRPAYAPFLGRRSCPPCWPFFPKLVEAQTLADAIAQAPVDDVRTAVGIPYTDVVRNGVSSPPERQVHADKAEGSEQGFFLRQRDAPVSRRHRTFAVRDVHVGTLPRRR